mmetsp:Transcript_1019/g.2631  ORF Transcript_1019/g.2631 Transcript_1019/m.2631 type:complete len:126 (-) Transcript_1019:115-492(-)
MFANTFAFFHMLTEIEEDRRWSDEVRFTCTCVPFAKDGACKHVLSEAIAQNMITVPHNEKRLVFRAHSKKPQKVRGALQRQPDDERFFQTQFFSIPDMGKGSSDAGASSGDGGVGGGERDVPEQT